MIDERQLRNNVMKAVEEVKATNPMAGSITNTVTIDFVANAQLAVGGSAAMVYLPDEGECLVGAGNAVYINMGTLFPNASEIIALAGLWGLEGDAAELSRARGVDTTDTVDAAHGAAVALARFTGGAVVVSGEVDLVTDGATVALSHGGSPLMSKITGCGCSQGGVLAVYATVADPFTAAVAGVSVYNTAGTRAAAVADAPASFKVAFIDELYRASAQDIAGNPLDLEEA